MAIARSRMDAPSEAIRAHKRHITTMVHRTLQAHAKTRVARRATQVTKEDTRS